MKSIQLACVLALGFQLHAQSPRLRAVYVDLARGLSAGCVTTFDPVAGTFFCGAGSSTALSGDVIGAPDFNTVSSVGGRTAAQIAAAVNLINSATASNVSSAPVRRDSNGDFVARNITADLIGNAASASVLRNNPTLCPLGQFARGIATTGDALGCATASGGGGGVPGGSSGQVQINVSGLFGGIDATSTSTANALVRRDGSGGFAAGTITANLTGNSSTASALASDPTACGSGQYVTDIAANGTLTCGTPAGAGGVGSATAGQLLRNVGGAVNGISLASAPASVSATEVPTMSDMQQAIDLKTVPFNTTTDRLKTAVISDTGAAAFVLVPLITEATFDGLSAVLQSGACALRYVGVPAVVRNVHVRSYNQANPPTDQSGSVQFTLYTSPATSSTTWTSIGVVTMASASSFTTNSLNNINIAADTDILICTSGTPATITKATIFPEIYARGI
jgi:hypothetical protein